MECHNNKNVINLKLWIGPFVRAGVREVVVQQQLIGFFGSPASVHVRNRFDSLLLDFVQERREDPPRLAQFVRPDEVHLRAAENVQHQAFVGVRQFHVLNHKIYIKIML